ncbi:MAG: 1-acyl-sn-glycerol-3-phosphate acyltransferase [Alphaproteobacteria bacterium CG11_big_fil_rev_8_21_14_0_20_44_7]|nr:MAG: 1-acyl-sn-glycerol-3-phosphate acyltransferase [Alphaproteobacteria bacterium CG11_big_fil_rev_8_21_14_0_20_44_7]
MKRVVIIGIIVLLISLPIAFISIFRPSLVSKSNNLIYQTVSRLFNLRIHRKGAKISKNKPLVFVSNHMSYLDIMVLGATLPGHFVSKAEVARWPIIGWVAALTGTIFINRKKSAAGSHLTLLENSLKRGKNLIFFPEGTTGDGVKQLPFKSSLFKIAEDMDITIQPVTIKYSHINGLPIQRNERSQIAWIGDMDFAPHINQFLKLGKVQVDVTLHEPIEGLKNRKEIAAKCQEIIGG